MFRFSTLMASAAIFIAASLPVFALEGVPAVVKTKQQGDGWLLTDAADGMTLYITDRDEATPGKSSCTAECAVTWPPFKASADA